MNVRDSRLVRMAQGAGRPSRWWLAWLVVMAVAVWVGPLGFSVGNTVLGDPGRTDLGYPVVPVFASLAVLLTLFLWVRFKERRPFATVGFRPARDSLRLLGGLAVGGVLAGVVVLLGLALGAYATGQSSHTRTGAEALVTLLPLVALYVLQGAGQEALTRGYLLQTSARQLPAWVAVVGTSALVAVLQSVNPVTMLNAFLYAAFASLVALQQGSLWLVIGVQAGWHLVQLNVLGLPVGGIPDASAVWSIGPASGSTSTLAGGSFGLDAGVLATVVLATATVVAYVRLRRTSPATTRPQTREASARVPLAVR